MNAIVVTFDRLPAGFLACCGNGWIATPNFDRLAAQSALFHQHFSNCPAAETACRGWWSGRYECRRDEKGNDRHWLPSLLGDHGITFRLLVETGGEGDRPDLGRIPMELGETVRGTDGVEVAAEETPFFRLVARAHRDLRLLRTSRREPWLLWIKSRGIPEPWLAPRDFASQFLDMADDEAEIQADEHDDGNSSEADGSEPDGDAEGLVEMSAEQFDELLRSMSKLPADRNARDALSGVDRNLMLRVCGGYVALLDAGLGRLLELIDHEPGIAPTLLIVTASKGVAVREPGVLLDDWESLAEETVHTPLFVRVVGTNRGVRRQELVQTVDLFPTLAEWFGIDLSESALDGKSLLPIIRGDKVELRSHALITGSHGRFGIRTNDFYLVTKCGDGEDASNRRLFAKPEDVWETSDVAAQSPGIVDELSSQITDVLADKDGSI
jgi:arylsulfatase A-like enzyme